MKFHFVNFMAYVSKFYDMQIQLLADLNLKKTPQLVELVDDSKVRTS